MISAPDHHDQPTFSIRDYVYSARHNHPIENNWPFSLHHLHPVPKHQINSLLPPFEPPDSVRRLLCISKPHSVEATTSATTSRSPLHPHNNKTHPKCRSDQTQTEDIMPTISDSMSSKLCPVCKTFSSTSNTTLNAHIDQCLAVEPALTRLPNHAKLTKHVTKTKPTKKRSMADIYATAQPCTLQELDRRNGSNWAANSCLPPALTKVVAGDDDAQSLSGKQTCDEGSVYFDSNGTKLRIISSFPNTPKKLIKSGRDCEVDLDSAKQHVPPENAKALRSKTRHRPLCALKPNENQLFGTHATTREMEKRSHKDNFNSQLLEACDGIEDGVSRTLQRWVWSKRRHRLKRISGKDKCSSVAHSSHMSMKPLIVRNKKNIGSSSLRGSFPTRNPSDYAVSSANTLCADSPLHESQVTDCQVDSHNGSESEKNLSTNERSTYPHGTCLMKFPACTEMFTTSPNSMRVEVTASTAGSSDDFAKDHESPVSTERVVKPSLFELMSELNIQPSSLKKPRMRRFRNETELQVGVWPSDSQHDSVPDAENRPRRYQIGATCNSDGPSDKLIPEVEGVNDQLSFGRVGVLTSRREREDSVFSEWDKSMASSSGAGNSYSLVHTKSCIGASFETLYSTASMDNFYDQEKGSEEVPAIKTFSTKTFASELSYLPDSLDSQANNSQSTGEHKGYAWETEELMSFVKSTLLDARGANKANEASRIKEVTDMVSKVNSQVVEIPSFEGQWRRRRTDPPSAPAPPPGSGLPSLRDMYAEDLHENLSLTSSNIVFAQDKHLAMNRYSSESPVSAISTNSPHTKTRSDSQFSDPESCAGPYAVQDKLILGFLGGQTEPIGGDAITSRLMASERAERLNLEREHSRATMIGPPEESLKVIDDQPCCCKWKKTLTAPMRQDPQLVKGRTRESSVLHGNGKSMAYSSNIQPDFDPVSGNSDMVTPLCEPSPEDVQRLTSHTDFRRGCTFSLVKNVKPTSNPILRLMGKNLMVVNPEDDSFRQPTPASENTFARTEYRKYSASSGSDQEGALSHSGVPEGSFVSNQGSSNPQLPLVKEDLSNFFTSHGHPRMHHSMWPKV